MRVRATAVGTAESNAIGSIELEATPAGLAVGLYGVGSYSEGYAPVALTHGTRITVAYSGLKRALAMTDRLLLEVEQDGFPYGRLTLTQFSAGPGVPPLELKRRRLILHLGALSLAVLAAIAASMLGPVSASGSLAWAALGYGTLAALLVVALGYSIDQRFFVRPPREEECRRAFVADLVRFYPDVSYSDEALPKKKPRQLPDLAGWMPRSAGAVGVTLAAALLTALVSGQRLLRSETSGGNALASRSSAPRIEAEPQPSSAHAAPDSNGPPIADSGNPASDEAADAPSEELEDMMVPADSDANAAAVERRCMCDRADSPLWQQPIPKLSALLIEKRTLPRKTYLKTRLEVAVVNNSDEPMKEITVHVQFYERRGKSKKRQHTKERPLYFEGPLRPGQAIKWTTEARGTEFEIQVPDFGTVGVDGAGSAGADAFAELLSANHRPVRLHASRLLSYLGDPRGREGALHLKDALRAAEGPFLRRVLAATAELRVCDIDLDGKSGGAPDGRSAGACVYNAGDLPAENVGLQILSLSASLSVDQPLAHPPEIVRQEKWKIPARLDAQAGVYVRVPIAPGFIETDGGSAELLADRFDLLD